jgi:hypothetical protein
VIIGLIAALWRARNRARAGAVGLATLAIVAGCEQGSVADGPRLNICGEWIGSAELLAGMTWYVDLTNGAGSQIGMPLVGEPTPTTGGQVPIPGLASEGPGCRSRMIASTGPT